VNDFFLLQNKQRNTIILKGYHHHLLLRQLAATHKYTHRYTHNARAHKRTIQWNTTKTWKQYHTRRET